MLRALQILSRVEKQRVIVTVTFLNGNIIFFINNGNGDAVNFGVMNIIVTFIIIMYT